MRPAGSCAGQMQASTSNSSATSLPRRPGARLESPRAQQWDPSFRACSPQSLAPQRQAVRAQRRVRVASGGDDDATPAPMGDWREFRAKLIAQTGGVPAGARRSENNRRLLQIQNPSLAAEGLWAHPTSEPEAGGLAIASLEAPDILHNDGLWQVVVFLLSHGADGTVGIILNKPTGMVLGRKAGGLPLVLQGAEEVQSAFSDTPVYCGGFTAQEVVHFMHGYKLPNAVEIVPGIYMGGQKEAAALVEERAEQTDRFKFFAGALTWGPGELVAQIRQGAWYTAACSRSLVLKQAVQLPVPLWREVLLLMGGQYVAVAKDGYEGDE